MPPYVAKLPEQYQAEAFERWQLARLNKIADLLPAPWKERQSILNEKHASSLAEIEDARKGRAIHRSSVPRDDLAQMEMEQLVAFAKSWKAESGDRSDDLDLGYALSHRISTAPQKFVEQKEALRQLDLNSIWWFFHALSQATREKRLFDWAPVISLAHEVYAGALVHARSQLLSASISPEAKSNSDWTRRAIVQLVDDGLRADESRIPESLMNDTLSLIEAAVVDPDPTQSDDLTRSRPGRVIDTAINCTRGIAFDALYHFVGCFKKDNASSNSFWPKIKLIVDNYLKDEASHRLVVHAMLGQLFPLLWQRDRDWGIAIRDVLFPQIEAKRVFFGAAWEGYVSVWRPAVDLFDDLQPAYSLVSHNLQRLFANERDEPSYAAVRTVEHVIREFGRGSEDLNEDETLLKELVSNASPQLRKTAIEIAGSYWSGANIANPSGKRFADRMQEFYSWRSDQCQKVGNREIAIEEVWAVGDWPRDGFADVDWWLDQLISILSTWNATPRHSGFSDYLPECATSHPETILAIVEALIDANRPEWSMISMHSDIKDA